MKGGLSGGGGVGSGGRGGGWGGWSGEAGDRGEVDCVGRESGVFQRNLELSQLAS